MTAFCEEPLRRERDDSQWADYGVNVGHAVYGDIHLHLPAEPTAHTRHRNGAEDPARTTWHTALGAALAALAHACDRAAAALANSRPDEAGKEEQ